MTDQEPEDPSDNGGLEKVNRGDSEVPPAPRGGGTAAWGAYQMDDRDKKLAITIEGRIERRISNIIRQESGDPYGGLPADDVLANLDRNHPEVRIPERMMERLEVEQTARHQHIANEDARMQYEAETRRIDAREDRNLVDRTANRAMAVFLILLAAGIGLVIAGYEAAGLLLLGSTMVGVVGAFLAQQLRGRAKAIAPNEPQGGNADGE